MILLEKEIQDTEIRVIGSDSLPVPDPKPPRRFKNIRRWLILGAIFIIIIITSFAIFFSLYYKVGVLGINKDIIEDAPKMVFYFNSIFRWIYTK